MSDSDTPTVLVIDDMNDIGELTSVYLERYDLDTIYEENPETALEEHNLAEVTTKIDCVVCDYDMPQMNGLEVLDNIRLTNPQLQFILYTGKGSEEIASEAVSMGVTDYIQKDSGENHYALLANRVNNAVQRYWAETAQQRSVERDILREIKGIFAQQETLEEKQRSLLKLGSDYLDMPAGFVSHVSKTHQTLLTTYGLDDISEDLYQCPLEKTYCKNTIEMSEPLMISNAENDVIIDDEAYQRWKIDSYIGTRIMVEGELYGTLCFIDSGDGHSFDEADEVFIDLLAQWLGYEISNEKSTARLETQRDNLEEFTTMVRHDLKNPLTVCMGHIDFLREEVGENTHLDKIESSANRINELLDDFSLLSKTIGELDTNNLDQINVNQVASDVWGECISEDGAELVIENCEDTQLKANEGLFRQILHNLFLNAVQHNDLPITVTVTRTESGMTIEDNGSGIPEDAGDIFAKGITSADGNTGHGLYITKKIVKAHGWDITVDSDDSGTKFTIDTLISTDLD